MTRLYPIDSWWTWYKCEQDPDDRVQLWAVWVVFLQCKRFLLALFSRLHLFFLSHTVMRKNAFVPYWVRWEHIFFSYMAKWAIPRNNWHNNFDKEFPIIMTFWNGKMSLSFRVSGVVIRGHRSFSAVPCRHGLPLICINSVEVHPQLSTIRHPVDGALVGAGWLCPPSPSESWTVGFLLWLQQETIYLI